MAASPDVSGNVIDDARVTGFHRRLAVFCSGGPFLDGYALGVIGLALPGVTAQWQLGGAWEGGLAASALFGLFFGGLVFGYVTDRIGRRLMYSVDLGAIALFAAAQFFVTGPEQLLVLRVLLGIAIGADYPIATSLLAEFAPKRSRAILIGMQTAMWSAGSAASYLVGGLLLQLGPDAWRWILLSPAVPALALAVLRVGTPESPRWLLNKGRAEEALAVLRRVYGPEATLDGIEAGPAKTRFGLVFTAPYGRRMLFVSIFWMCSITPVYAIYAFAPQLLEALGIDAKDANAGSILIGLLFLVGTLIATVLAGRIRRRTMLVVPFYVASAVLVLLGLTRSSAVLVTILLGVYALVIGGPTILQWIYPNELFPTEIRATAMGIGVAISRIGAVLGTFVVPLLIGGAGIAATMIIVGVFSAIGAVASSIMAPETHGRPLTDAATC